MWRDGGWTPDAVAEQLRPDPRPAPPDRRHGHARRHGVLGRRSRSAVVVRLPARRRRRRLLVRARGARVAPRGARRWASSTSTCWSTSTRRRSCCRSGARPRSRSRSRAGARRRRRRAADGHVGVDACAVARARRARCSSRGPARSSTRAETARAMIDEVPGLRLLVDTGHVADWGGDPLEMLEFADHVQLRQGRPGSTQVHVDDPRRGRRLRGRRSPASTSSTTRAASRSSTSTSPSTAGPSTTPSPGPPTSPPRPRPLTPPSALSGFSLLTVRERHQQSGDRCHTRVEVCLGHGRRDRTHRCPTVRVVHARPGVAAGFSRRPDPVARLESGRWERRQPGVYRVAGAPDTLGAAHPRGGARGGAGRCRVARLGRRAVGTSPDDAGPGRDHGRGRSPAEAATRSCASCAVVPGRGPAYGAVASRSTSVPRLLVDLSTFWSPGQLSVALDEMLRRNETTLWSRRAVCPPARIGPGPTLRRDRRAW